MAELGMTAYDLEQQVMRGVAKMDEYNLRMNLTNIGAWFSSNVGEQYYMLLNKELSDYTIFNLVSLNYHKGVQELQEVLENRGDILQVDYNHEYEYFEIWVRYCEDLFPHMYILFPCPEFVIEV